MNKKVNIGLLFLILPILFFFFINFSREHDIWFLLAHGKYLLSHGIPHTDILSMHSNFHFVMQQYGFSLIISIIFQYFGSIGVILFIGVLNFLILFFLYKLCLLLSSDNQYFSLLIASFIDLLLELMFIVPRPQVLSLLLFLLLVYLVERFVKYHSNSLCWLPVISLVLVNTHASMWILLFIFCLPFLVEFFYLFITKKDTRIWTFLFFLSLSFLVGFINPYGYEAMFYSFDSYGIKVINSLVFEMSHFSLSLQNPISCYSYLFLFLFIFELYGMIKNHKKYSIHSFLLFLGVSLMAFLNARNIAFFLLLGFPYVIGIFKKNINSVLNIRIFFSICFIVGVVFIYNYVGNYYKLVDREMEKTVQYLDQNYKKNISIFNDFDDGPYLEYHGYKAYIDTRAEVFIKKMNKKKDVLEEYSNVLSGTINYDDFISHYQFQIFIVSKKSAIYHYLVSQKDYSLVYHDKYRFIFEKNNI